MTCAPVPVRYVWPADIAKVPVTSKARSPAAMSSVPEVILIESALRAVLSALNVVPLVIAITLKSLFAPWPPASISDIPPPSNVTVEESDVNMPTPYQSPPMLIEALPEQVSIPTSKSPSMFNTPVEMVISSPFTTFSSTFSVLAPTASVPQAIVSVPVTFVAPGAIVYTASPSTSLRVRSW